MSTSGALREVFTAGRPLVEAWLDIGEQIAALREVATAKGLDWSQVKALLKAQIHDERDERGDGKRVARIVEKAEFASAYADMLGLSNMNENIFSPQSKGETNGPEVEPAASSFDEIAETDSNSQPTSSPDANKTGAEPPPSAPVAPIEDDFEPPAFLARKKPMRPHCLNPECCAGQGYEHCHRCKKAMAESEAA